MCAACRHAHGYEFRARWVERVGNTDVALFDNILDASFGGAHRARLQIGIFDDAAGEAPVGGVFGWTGGLVVQTPTPAHSAETRTPGRLTPFISSTDAGANGNPPLPGGDPFEALTDIDATIGMQSLVWGFNDDGSPAPQPLPTIRGRNRFISVYEITVEPLIRNITGYYVRPSGVALGASSWVPVEAVPPDPDSGIPGSITYAPALIDPTSFDAPLFVYVIPTPGFAVAICTMLLITGDRRR